MKTVYHEDSQIIGFEEEYPIFYQPTDEDRKLLSFVVDHTDRWRSYREVNYDNDFDKYERIFRGKWSQSDKTRQSERSRIISPATQQAIETRHAEIMEAVFGKGEFFDIKDDILDSNGTKVDVEALKAKLNEDFSQDKIRKAIEETILLAEIYGTGIAEIAVGIQKQYKPMAVPIDQFNTAYGVGEKERVSVKLTPVNPKNFIFDPNGTSVDDCMGVAIERYTSIHKIAKGIKDGIYRNIDITSMFKSDELEATQESASYRDDKVLLLTYYGLVPRKYLELEENKSEVEEDTSQELQEERQIYQEIDDYTDMVEAIVVICNGSEILKAEMTPYMMKDRPVITYQADTVPNRLFGRGTAEKAYNMQAAIDGSARAHMDALALTTAPMIAMDATRLPRGFKFEIKPGGGIATNGNPNDILYPFKFGTNDSQAMETSKEFERMLLMATGTIDSAGQANQLVRDSGIDLATSTLIKKYKRTLVNFQEDFLIPFINKAAWRYMQFAPERYPSVDVKFIPTGTLGIIAREYEQKQLAFLIQTLGAQSPLTPILMQGIIENSSLPKREEMLEQLKQASQPNPQQQQIQQQAAMLDMQAKQADVQKTQAEAQKTMVEAQIAPDIAKAKLIAALSNNLDDNAEGKDFERRVEIAKLMLKEYDINSNERIAKMQTDAKTKNQPQDDLLENASRIIQ